MRNMGRASGVLNRTLRLEREKKNEEPNFGHLPQGPLGGGVAGSWGTPCREVC